MINPRPVIPEILPSQAEHKLIDGSIVLPINCHIGFFTSIPSLPLTTCRNDNA